MSKNHQSIEELINAEQGEADSEESATGKFSVLQGKIKHDETERAVEADAAGRGLPYINLFGFPISPEALSLVSEETARTQAVICFFYDGERIRLASLDPENEAVKEIAAKLEKEYFCAVKFYLFSPYSLEYALKLYSALPKVRVITRGLSIKEEDLNRFSEKITSFKDLQAQIADVDITETITLLLAAAIKSDASDVHIEAEEAGIKVRYRIDGILHDAALIEKKAWPKIISRLKLLAGVKINVDEKPQDGRTSIHLRNERIDIRVSFLPTNFGESVVMRLLRASAVGLEFEMLGLRGSSFAQLKREVERPNGMIITTGPTGSGKTTTLYAILKKLNSPDTKIITAEDPIEYQLPGINQSQISANYTFAQGLRSIVRQDPDVIMVGEIRDLETAEIAIQAALTGHLVLSTIHTNDAAGTVPRLLSMGAKPFLIAPALNAMIGQRLVRKICEHCREPFVPPPDDLARVRTLLDQLPTEEKAKINPDQLAFYRGRGCDHCQDIGFKGRVGIYEIMTMNAEIEKLILSGQASEYDMRDAARKNGMITMAQDGVLKALEGITSLEEVFRVAE